MAKQGFGSTFQLQATAISGSQGLLAEVTTVGIPEIQTAWIDTTHHGSTGGIEEGLPGLVSMGDVPIEMNLVPGSATDLACAAAAVSRTIYYFKSTVPASSGTWTYTGQCVVTSYKPEAVGTEGKMD